MGALPNRLIAERLAEAADLLETQQDNPFRVRAYRRAAAAVAEAREDLGVVLDRDGAAGLDAMPGIGPGIASAIAEMLRTGRWTQLDRLRGAVDPEVAFLAIPGVGPGLARLMHRELDVDTLEALESAALDGRLA